MHKIVPIPKPGDLCLITNYRPISLLCIISKLLESIIFKTSIDFVRPRLSQAKFASCKCSSATQLLACYSKVVDGFEKGCTTDIIYLDLKKAFDSPPTMNHCSNLGD